MDDPHGRVDDHTPTSSFATNPLRAKVAEKIPEQQGLLDTGLVMTSFRTDEQNRMIFGSIGRLDAVAEGTPRLCHALRAQDFS